MGGSAVVSQTNLGNGGSDHDALQIVLQLGGANKFLAKKAPTLPSAQSDATSPPVSSSSTSRVVTSRYTTNIPRKYELPSTTRSARSASMPEARAPLAGVM